MIELLKRSLHPASASMILALVVVAVVLLYVGWTRLARTWLTAVVLLYWTMATPVCAMWLQRPLTGGYRPLPSADRAEGARVIVLLSGGADSYAVSGSRLMVANDPSAFRSIEAARVYRLLGDATVIASGGIADRRRQSSAEGDALRQALVELGVPARQILVETESSNTRTEALRVGSMLDAMRVSRFVLVTSPTHMRRSMAAFAAVGLHPIPSVSAQESDFQRRNRFEPSEHALRLSEAALYEYAALAYYWSRGWLTPQAPASSMLRAPTARTSHRPERDTFRPSLGSN